MGSYESEYQTHEDLLEWADNNFVAWDEEDARLICLSSSCPNERVFHGKENSLKDFFFVYTYLFNQMFARVPFIVFQSTMLRKMNVAPTQLHSNGWVCIQLCSSHFLEEGPSVGRVGLTVMTIS